MLTQNHSLVELALEKASGSSFELFCNGFFAALNGQSFIPLGGMHDGGAEAFSSPELYFESQRNDHFWQMSVQDNFREKVRTTVKRIRAFGRSLNQLTYCSSNVIKAIDVEEDSLSEELNVRLRIRDRKYIVSHVNNSEATIQAYNSYLAPQLSYLKEIGGSSIIGHSKDLPSRTLCTFLGQEVERRSGNNQLLESVTDSLILWSLEGTDAAKNIFLDRERILKKIEEALPAAKQFIRSVLDNRLTALTKKTNTKGREIRWHSKEKAYCLPFETRKIVEIENTEDETIRSSVSQVFTDRCNELLDFSEVEEIKVPAVVELCHRALEITFERQGLDLSYFILADEVEDQLENNVADNVDSAIDQAGLNGEKSVRIKELCLSIIRRSLYKSEECERIYLSKMSRTYSLLFTLKNEPRIVEYFRNMSTEFILYVGSDLVVRAISERYLAPADRMTWNLFSILRAAGATVILAEPTLDEIITHLRAQDNEYRNHYQTIDSIISLEIARNIGRLLIRSYFYARLEERQGHKGPSSWPSYIEQFCSYSDLHSKSGRDSLRRTLCEEFGFSFEGLSEMKAGIPAEEIEQLKQEILSVRHGRAKELEEVLAFNDALQVLRVYQKRFIMNELSKPNPYGFRVWWLTSESLVRKATGKLIQKNGSRYMMRPEFLLNFIAIAPSAEEVRKSFEKVFPSLLGVRLSNRMKPEILTSLMSGIRSARAISENRARAKVGELSDYLKSDFNRSYEFKFEN